LIEISFALMDYREDQLVGHKVDDKGEQLEIKWALGEQLE